MKDLIFPFIEKQERDMLGKFFKRFEYNKNLIILGPHYPINRVSIVSFTVKHEDRLLHCNFIVKLLSDLFGIQARSGCSCAGPYGHKLLNIDENVSLKLMKMVKTSKDEDAYDGIKFGWARINLHYSLENADFEYILNAIDFISEHGYKFLFHYYFEPHSGNWTHFNEISIRELNKLSLRFLLTDKLYASSEECRRILMKQHLEEAKKLV